jgi:REP element-mobilizing transposase RayT
VILCGIERKAIFKGDADRSGFLQRLEYNISATSTPCYAWALMTNHVHLLLRTGIVPLATLMRRLLTGCVISFNRRRRHDQLFQNRYKSILCQEDVYLLELVSYIHLNPLRSGIVSNVNDLDGYPHTGHSDLLVKQVAGWQDTDNILELFGSKRALLILSS